MSDNLLIRMASRDKGTVHPFQQVEHYSIAISQAMLEEMRELAAHGVETGRRFLELLGAVDHAGQQRKPVMLMGRKQRGPDAGFILHVSIPISRERLVNPFAGPEAGTVPDRPASIPQEG